MWNLWIACLGLVAASASASSFVWRRAGRHVGRGRSVGRLVATFLALIGAPALGLGSYLSWHLLMGQPKPSTLELQPGVVVERHVHTLPRPIVLHAVRIPMRAIASIEVTPPEVTDEGLRVRASQAATAAAALDADIVINGSYFFPCWSEHPFDYAPHVGDAVQVVGAAVGRGVRYGTDEPEWPTFVVAVDTHGARADFGVPDESTHTALSGRQWLVRRGELAIVPSSDPYPRTALGLDATRERLWLVVVDGKQPGYSEGMTLEELSRWLRDHQIAHAIELDGGGSSVLALRDGNETRLTSRPCHSQIPGRERPVANHLAVRLRRDSWVRSAGDDTEIQSESSPSHRAGKRATIFASSRQRMPEAPRDRSIPQ